MPDQNELSKSDQENNMIQDNSSDTSLNSGISLYSMIKALSGAMDLISETVVGHHKKTAYVSLRLGQAMDLAPCQIKRLVIAALVHDMGVFYLDQKYSDLSFDNPSNKHAEVGYQLARGHFPDETITEAVRHHHDDWEHGSRKDEIPRLSHYIHLADRIAVMIENRANRQENFWQQKEKVKSVMSNLAGDKFYPPAVKAFNEDVAETEYFWLDIQSPGIIDDRLDAFCRKNKWYLSLNQLDSLGMLLSYITDYRSPFTATHSQGIASSSRLLSKKLGYSSRESRLIKTAGHLHDIGKLIVPTDILNKPGKLNNKEWNIMKTHTYYTYQALTALEELPEMKKWAAYHHERLDGKGYPFRLDKDELSCEAGIISVADVFTALTENRPYRDGMAETKVKKILDDMSKENKIDGKIAGIVIDEYQDFFRLNQQNQTQARTEYDEFQKQVEQQIF